MAFLRVPLVACPVRRSAPDLPSSSCALSIEVSGSMSRNADLEGEGVGLNVLDIVKHALKTVVRSIDVTDDV